MYYRLNVILLCSLFSTQVLAQDLSASCKVGISFIKGSAEKEQSEAFDSNVLEQLKGLPFSSYSLIKKEEKTVKLEQSADFVSTKDGGGFKVSVKPEKIEGERVQALIDWNEESGENVLSTKMWFTNGKSMVFGAEQGNTLCTIIDVAIKCD